MDKVSACRIHLPFNFISVRHYIQVLPLRINKIGMSYVHANVRQHRLSLLESIASLLYSLSSVHKWQIKLISAFQCAVICCLVNGQVIALDLQGTVVWKVHINILLRFSVFLYPIEIC